MSLIKTGGEDIVRALLEMPGTRHPIDEPPERKKMIVDAFQMGAVPNIVLLIVVHGEFTEGKFFLKKHLHGE